MYIVQMTHNITIISINSCILKQFKLLRYTINYAQLRKMLEILISGILRFIKQIKNN